jgi:hypothetical protein
MLQLFLFGVLSLLVVFVARQALMVVRADPDIYSRRAGRLAAAVLLGIALGLGMHSDTAARRAGGREAFLQSQAARFDRFIDKPHSLVPAFIAGALVGIAAAGVYELMAWGFYRVVRPAKKEGAK